MGHKEQICNEYRSMKMGSGIHSTRWNLLCAIKIQKVLTVPWQGFLTNYLIMLWIYWTHGCYNLTKFRQNRIKNKKIFITRTFFVNKQLTLFFNYLKKYSLNFAQNFRECSFNLAGSESGEKSKWFQFFVYISQLFVYKTRLWT